MNHGVYIATKNRENDVFKFLDSLVLNHSIFEVIIIDSTEPKERFAAFHREIEARYPKLKVTHIFHSGRLPSARNAGLDLRIRHDLIHFFDDDVTIPSDYFEKIEAFLSSNLDVDGGGPRIKGSYIADMNRRESIPLEILRRLQNIRLKYRRYGSVNRACKHYWVPDKLGSSQVVEWIPGCSMFFKPHVFEHFRFNSRMETGFSGYAFGEDMEFTYRVGREFKLMSVDTTSIEHHLAPSPRSDMLFIASCLGATTAHMYTLFPDRFSKFRIHLEKLIEFYLQSLKLEDRKFSALTTSFKKFRVEFEREVKEKNWMDS